jgi:sugar lactone lactonase YvrE
MEFTQIATGYCFLEAPRVAGPHLWFSDLLLGGLHRLSPDGSVDAYWTDRLNIGGICLNDDGRILCGGPGGLGWLDPESGRTGMVLDRIDGRVFSGVNDFIPDGKGGLYFGTLSKGGDYDQEPGPTDLYHLHPDGQVDRMNDGLSFSNGMGLSPDGSRLYHVESLKGIFAYDVLADGSLANKALFLPVEDGDGLAVDAAGGVWIAHFASAQLARYRPDGALDRAWPLPHKAVSSICFGGPDWRDLYVTTAGDKGIEALFTGELPPRQASIFRARSDIPGVPVPMTQFR